MQQFCIAMMNLVLFAFKTSTDLNKVWMVQTFLEIQ